MGFQIKRTNTVQQESITLMGYGPAGVGKTLLAATAPRDRTLILSAESGLLTLAKYDMAYVPVTDIGTVAEVMRAIDGNSKEVADYEWIVLDSLSEIAEVCLASEKENNRDARKAYGEMQDKIAKMIRWFRDCDRNVYMSLKQQESAPDDNGRVVYGPSMPSRKLASGVAYYPDFVFTFRQVLDPETAEQRTALTFARTASHPNLKARGDALGDCEPPSLTKIADKIRNNT